MNRLQIILVGSIGVVFIFAVLVFTGIIPGLREGRSADVRLEFWGVYDDSRVYADFISKFKEENPNITIIYKKKSVDSAEFEKELIEALASGQGPDIWMIHNSWVPKHQNKISPVPTELSENSKELDILNPVIYKNTFVDVAYNDFVKDGKVLGIPLSVDTMALFYNKDLLASAGIAEPPLDWDEFLKNVKILTKFDKQGNIVRAAAAIGTAKNINRSTDILSLLMLQQGTDIVDEQRKQAIFDKSILVDSKSFSPGEQALKFYTQFTDPTKDVYTWNIFQHFSIDAFYEGTTAMMFNYSFRMPEVKAKSKYLNFDVSFMPQIKNRKFDVNYANYWALTVSKNTKYSNEAWKFVQFLTSKDNSQKYLEITKRPTARKDLVDLQRYDSDLGVFALQALSARSWYQPDYAGVETIFADMIESVVKGETTHKNALKKAEDQVNVLMR